MFKVGDRVYMINHPGRLGVVVEIDKEGDPKIKWPSGLTLRHYSKGIAKRLNSEDLTALKEDV